MNRRGSADPDSPWFMAFRDGLRIDIYHRESPGVDDYNDGNWLNARWRVRNSVARAEWRGPYIRSEELQRFGELLPRLRSGEARTATFAPMEGWWELEVRRQDDSGHFMLVVVLDKLNPSPGQCNSHHRFEFVIDQTGLRAAEAQIHSLLREFPVIGTP